MHDSIHFGRQSEGHRKDELGGIEHIGVCRTTARQPLDCGKSPRVETMLAYMLTFLQISLCLLELQARVESLPRVGWERSTSHYMNREDRILVFGFAPNDYTLINRVCSLNCAQITS